MRNERYSTGNPWERRFGFSRAVRAGNVVYTAGTVAADEEGRIHGDSAYEQCCYVFEKLARVLGEAGSGLDHVVKVVCYLTDLADGEEFGRAHHRYLGHVKPVATCVAVSQLFGEGARVEIELTAVVPEAQAGPLLK